MNSIVTMVHGTMRKTQRLCLPVAILLLNSIPADAQELAQTPELIRGLGHKDTARVIAATEALGAMGPAAADAVPELVRVLRGDDPDIRAAAARSLAHIGVADKSVCTALLDAMRDNRSTSDVGPVWASAAQALGTLQADVVPELIVRLEDKREFARNAAATAVHVMGAKAASAVPALTQMLKHSDPETRRAGIYGLLGIGPLAADSVPSLIELLSSENFHTQYWSCRALASIGAPAAKPAVPVLISLVGDGAPSVRRNAAYALGRIGPAAGREIIPPLESALKDGSYSVRQAAARALGRLGPFAVEAGPSLQAALDDPRFAARVEAAVALWKTTGKTRQPIAVILNEIARPDAPWDAASAFGELGAHAEPAVPRLRQLLRDERAETRLFVAIALGEIGPAAHDALPDLKALLDDEDEDVQEAAERSIAAITGRTDA